MTEKRWLKIVEPLQAYAILTGLIYLTFNFIGYYLTEDFTGIIGGIAVATITQYYGRTLLLGIATAVVQ